ncbi:amidohydrolase family protein [Amycolatopsis sp. NPDC059027]|uniref:amidohydrolase family protein n=1 Tax=Amycolatopsis sp. NPDC059027 TaxID=3346709 RepID=UPI00367353C9
MTALHLAGVILPGGEPGELWIDGGRISFTRVPGAETLTREGFLVPGLVDAHCHPGLAAHGPATLAEAAEQAAADRDAGTLLIRDCGLPLDVRPLQARADLPTIIRAGQHLALRKRYIPGFGLELDDPAQLPAAVVEQARDGDGWVKLVGDWIDRGAGDLAPLWPDDVLAEAIAAAHAEGARVTAHVFGQEALPGLIAAGIDCLEHGTELSPEQLDELARRDIALVPTLIQIENFPGIADKAGKYPAYAAHMRALHAGVGEMVASAVEAGVRVFAGSDAGGMVEHGRLVDEIEALHKAGMPAEQALGQASWAARDWLGHPGIADGAPADLLVYPADPREDLGVLRHPTHIVLGGTVFA